MENLEVDLRNQRDALRLFLPLLDLLATLKWTPKGITLLRAKHLSSFHFVTHITNHHLHYIYPLT